MVFVGIDWSEEHNEVEIQSAHGKVLGHRQVAADMAGLSQFQEMVVEHSEDADEVVIGIETSGGLWVNALVGCGYRVYPINPKTSARAREGDSMAGAKSDRSDAHLLANLVRTRYRDLRPLAGDSELAQAVQVRARTHLRAVRMANRARAQLRAALAWYFPAAVELLGTEQTEFRDALAVLSVAPTPELARRLSVNKLQSTLKHHGRQRYLEARATQIRAKLQAPQLELSSHRVVAAHRDEVSFLVRTLLQLRSEIDQLEALMNQDFELHPDAEILRSLPGLGPTLGARVLAELGDDPTRYNNARARKNYAGTSPVTRSSGKWQVVTRRTACNRRLTDALMLGARCSLNVSPGCRQYYDQLRARGQGHNQALRMLANRLVGILHGCLRTGRLYDEALAWPPALKAVA